MQRKSHLRELVRLRTGREIPDLLQELYVEQRHSQAAIAEALGCSRWQVNQWLSEFSISRDDRRAVEIEAPAS